MYLFCCCFFSVDHSRVFLLKLPPNDRIKQSDYINANYVDVSKQKKFFPMLLISLRYSHYLNYVWLVPLSTTSFSYIVAVSYNVGVPEYLEKTKDIEESY